jgi:predicted transposase/invertase (TIGR01784 family)
MTPKEIRNLLKSVPNKLLLPKKDEPFKRIFRNKEVLTAFISAVLKIPEKRLAGIKLINPAVKKRLLKDKGIILDVLAVTISNSYINLEIQLVKTAHFIDRAFYYNTRLVQGLLRKGEDYVLLGNRQAISIVLTDFKLFNDDRFYRCAKYCDTETGKPLTNISEVHFIELTKVPKTFDGSGLTLWSMYFAADDEEDLMKLIGKNGVMDQAIIQTARMSADDSVRYAQDRADKARLDYISTINQKDRLIQKVIREKDEALQQKNELAQEKSDLAIQFAKTLLTQKDSSLKKIAQLTKLPVKVIKNLKNQ